jgi:hypothetical protein
MHCGKNVSLRLVNGAHDGIKPSCRHATGKHQMNSSNALRNTDHVDINHGLDYELARENLNAAAGRAWRQYLAAKQMQKPEAEIIELRAAYVETQNEFKNLKRTDTAAITAILAGGRA